MILSQLNLFQGLRTDSSNYNPVQFWLSGVQIAALNFQKCEKELQINQGWFLQNGGCGYVLKPNSMTKGCFELPAISDESFSLSISIISGRHLNDILRQEEIGSKRKNPTNTVVKVEVFGHPVDCAFGITKICQVA